jgi:two-component system alkaline phosphatase synthesis response regulator PhoP
LGKKILIVDDEPVIVKMLETRLKAGGYEVFTTHSGEEGLEQCKSLKPDAVILDIMMPDMDGSEVAAHMHEDSNLKHIPIIFLTAAIKPKEVPKDRKIGGHYFLSKAFKMEELLGIIKKILPEE